MVEFGKSYTLIGRSNVWFVVSAWSTCGFEKVLVSDGVYQTVVRPCDLVAQ